MRRLGFLIAFLVVPSPAAAAMGELPFEPMPKRAAAACVRPTGVPGGLALAGPRSVGLRSAGADGTAPAGRVRLGPLSTCPVVSETPSGAAVVAAVVAVRQPRDRFDNQVQAAVRDAGGRFGPPVRLAGGPYPGSVSAAASQSGHAVVAWAQLDGFPYERRQRVRILATRRAPGGSFGAIEALTPWRDAGRYGQAKVVAAIDASGTATVAWLRSRSRRGTAVETATVSPGGRFSVEQLPTGSQDVEHLALAVAPDGWALLAHADYNRVTVLERPPAGTFREVPLETPRWGTVRPVVAVRDGGGGLVAWRTLAPPGRGGVLAATRAEPGRFGRARMVAPEVRPRFGDAGGEFVVFATTGLYDEENPLRAAIAPDGRALLAWTIERSLGVTSPRLARGDLADGFGSAERLGSPVRPANGVAPLFLPDGRAAVAWTDNGGEYGERDGRLHLAIDSVPVRPSSRPPRVTLHSPGVQRLFRSEPLVVTVGCSRACDVRAAIAGGEGAVSATRLEGGRVRLELHRGYRPRRDRVRVVARATAPNGRRVATASQRIRIIRRPPLPVPRPTGVRARRRGDSIIVSWRTAAPARRTVFGVEGRRNRRRGRDFPLLDALGYRFGRGRTRFQVRLSPRRPERVRWVAVHANSRDSERLRHIVIVRVSGGRSRA